jgi:hypothetical protein
MVTLHGKEIKVGDKVWDSHYGWSEVVSLYGNEYYVIETNYSYYDADGKFYRNDILPRLFWNEFEVPKCAFTKPLPDLKVDTRVLVWNNGVKEKRYFSHFDKYGNMRCFNNGVTGWINKNAATTAWDNWEIYKEE